jgi:hypothetical protein
MQPVNLELAAQFRKVAAELRKEAVETKKRHAIKCAQVLTAARGLNQLKRILRGAER